MKPFEGLLGNSCELRLLEFLLPLEGLEFNISELAEEVNISRPTLTKVVQMFSEWGLLLSSKNGNITTYSINMNSSIVASIQEFNNMLIETMLGEEALFEIHDYLEEKRPRFEMDGLTVDEMIPGICTTREIDAPYLKNGWFSNQSKTMALKPKYSMWESI
ncbi:winged helix-turn-helix domain-containing protein [Methanococcoides burtonii]|uniref:HTH arsR-type domain-containing protein n=1 Tax=Methanococcoides burtonii (strain DSM 6242 / NBRC 107633 / OCM 468 / ACE-M) TaxID=259564 RepID=Q12X91_METBU|nr:winged helix-turn-helix domain-containing protein [Methanococcoides burtonii]ABE51935.1 Hypothetical protein Mbur_0996 [Methanococcoides burtonii DSM 6242]